MFFWRRWILKNSTFHGIASRLGIGGHIISVKGVDLWYESFGNPKDPVILLIMGAGCQGIFWTESFCLKLVEKGFFVIRFDNRDTGFSSYFNYKKNPYNFMDMALDVLALVDNLGINKAHLMGISMGGAIAQLLAANFPSRVSSLTLIATTNDFRPVAAVIEKKPDLNNALSSPDEAWFSWIKELEALPSWAFKRKISKHLEGWKLLNGNGVTFEEKYYKRLMIESIKRQRSFFSILNHREALLASVSLMLKTKVPPGIPTLIVHGGCDPLFPKDHAEHLASCIPGSELLLLDTMGHNFNRQFHSEVLARVTMFLKR